MSDEIFFSKMVTKGLEPIESEGRFFEGYLTVQVKDKQGEVTIVDELYKVLPIWMDRGAPITDTHSNRVIGKGINFSRSDYTDVNGDIYPAIKVTGKIYKDYELDNEIWNKIKSGEYKGLSFGGSTKTDREPMRMKDGSIAYSLSKLEHYEVAVCRDPAVPLAVITDVNPIAKSNIACDKTGCYVTKPVLGKPNFESAVRNVMEESDVPRKNAERIVGAAENKKADDVIVPEQTLDLCKHCGLPKKADEPFLSNSWEAVRHDQRQQEKKKKKKRKKKGGLGGLHGALDYRDLDEKLDAAKKKKKVKKGKQVKAKKKKKKQAQGIGNTRGWGVYKVLVDTNKILGKYQSNILKLSRILDKDAPKDIAQPHQTGNVPKKQPKEPKGQSHAAQSTDARLGFDTGDISPSEGWYRDSQGGQPDISGRDESAMNYVNPDSFDRDLKYIKPSYRNPRGDPRKRKSLFVTIYNKIKVGKGSKWHYKFPSDKPRPIKPKKGKAGDEEKNRKLMETMSPEVKLNYLRNLEAMKNPKPSHQYKIHEDHEELKPKKGEGNNQFTRGSRKGKKKLKKVGSGAMIDPNQANQGAGFAIRNQTPPKRKKTRTMEAKLGDGTYDYSS